MRAPTMSLLLLWGVGCTCGTTPAEWTIASSPTPIGGWASFNAAGDLTLRIKGPKSAPNVEVTTGEGAPLFTTATADGDGWVVVIEQPGDSGDALVAIEVPRPGQDSAYLVYEIGWATVLDVGETEIASSDGVFSVLFPQGQLRAGQRVAISGFAMGGRRGVLTSDYTVVTPTPMSVRAQLAPAPEPGARLTGVEVRRLAVGQRPTLVPSVVHPELARVIFTAELPGAFFLAREGSAP